MRQFKLNQLMATSFITMAMSGAILSQQPTPRVLRTPLMPQSRTAQQNPSSDVQAELAAPTNGLEAARLYSTLQQRANNNDASAQKVLSQFKGSDFQTLSKAVEAANAYNQAAKSQTGASTGTATMPTTTPQATPMARTAMVAPQTRMPSRIQPSPIINEAQTELKVPTDRQQSMDLYYILKRKASKGDKIAEDALKGLTSLDFNLNNAKIKGAVDRYNQALKEQKLLQEVAVAAPVTAKPTEEIPSPSTATTPSATPTLKDVEKKAPEETTTSKYRALAEKCLTMVDAERQQYEEKIKALEVKLGTKPEAQKKRDFLAEYEDLYKKLLSGSADPKEEARLNLELGKLEREAEMAGVPLGEAAEKKAQEEKLKEMKAQQMQARAAQKKEEEEKDKQAYDTKASWLPTLASQPLAAYLKLADKAMFNDFVNATQSLRIGGMIEKEGNENVLRALRHMVRKFQNEGTLIPKQKDELSFLANKIDLKLSSMGVKASSQGAQGGSFAALPEDKEAYDKFQYVWGEAQKAPAGKLYKDISRTRNTDELIKIITSPESSLNNINFDAVKLRSISFSKATLLELQAFKYALSQVRTSSFNPAAVKELTQTINDQIRILEKEVPTNLKERTQEEERIAVVKFGQAKPKVSGAPGAPQAAGTGATTAGAAPVRKAPPVIKKALTPSREAPVAASNQQAIDPELAKIVEKLQEQGVSAMQAYKVAGKLRAMGKTYGEGAPVPEQDIDDAKAALLSPRK